MLVRALVVAAGVTLAGVWLARGPARVLGRSWSARIAVEGGSMAPTLLPGDWLLVDPDAHARARPSVGELVLVHDPRRTDRLLVKRVASVLADGGFEVVGDAPASTDSRTFGAVGASGLVGRPWFRYWPPTRFGLIR